MKIRMQSMVCLIIVIGAMSSAASPAMSEDRTAMQEARVYHQQMIGNLNATNAALKRVYDVNSATRAAPELRRLANSLERLTSQGRTLASRLSKSEMNQLKSEFAVPLSNARSQIMSELLRIYRIPGPYASDIIKAAMR